MAYTRTEQDKSIANLRALAASGAVYRVAEPAPAVGYRSGEWLATAYYLNDDGSDMVRADGTRVSPASRVCADEGAAINVATEHNIDTIDRANHPDWFMRGGYVRKARRPRDKSDALSA